VNSIDFAALPNCSDDLMFQPRLNAKASEYSQQHNTTEMGCRLFSSTIRKT